MIIISFEPRFPAPLIAKSADSLLHSTMPGASLSCGMFDNAPPGAAAVIACMLTNYIQSIKISSFRDQSANLGRCFPFSKIANDICE